MRNLFGLLLLALPFQCSAGRYSDALSEAGDGFEMLLWIPIGFAAYLYKRFDASGNGGVAAFAGGGVGLALVYAFPLVSAAALCVVFGALVLLQVFD